MGKISDSAANDILDVMFGKVANPFPSTYYVALSSTQPANDGTNITEPSTSGTAYARVTLANNTTSFPGASARETAINVDLTYPEATADWGDELGWFAIMDSATVGAGNMIGWGALGTPITVIAGGIPTFLAGSLVITAPGV